MKGTLHKTEQGWMVRHCDYVLKNEFQLPLHHEDVEQLNEWVLDYPSYGITSEEVEFEIVQIASDNMGKVDTYAKLIKTEYPELEGTLALCEDVITSGPQYIPEISDEEIENDAWERFITDSGRFGFISGAKWYREQLKNKSNG